MCPAIVILSLYLIWIHTSIDYKIGYIAFRCLCTILDELMRIILNSGFVRASTRRNFVFASVSLKPELFMAFQACRLGGDRDPCDCSRSVT